MAVVTVVAVQSFTYQTKAVHRGQAVTMEAIDAAIHARLGHVSLDPAKRPTYSTRELVAAEPTMTAAMPITVEVMPKRRRGRPRKTQAPA